MKAVLVIAVVSVLSLFQGRAEEVTVPTLFASLKEAVLTTLLKEAPPAVLFTVAMAYEHSENIFDAPSPEVEKRLLAIPGVRNELYVPRWDLDIPFGKLAERQPDGSMIFPGVTRTGTNKRVDVYCVDRFGWRTGNEVRVHWSKSSGPLAGEGGTALFRHDKNGWHFVKHLEHVES